jgi:hypothetical protein
MRRENIMWKYRAIQYTYRLPFFKVLKMSSRDKDELYDKIKKEWFKVGYLPSGEPVYQHTEGNFAKLSGGNMLTMTEKELHSVTARSLKKEETVSSGNYLKRWTKKEQK